MKVVRPIEITEAVLTASSILEPDASVGEVEWQADIFSGFVFTNKSYHDQGFIHAVKSGETLYALETKETNIGSNGVMHKYDSTGTHTGSFSVDGTIKSFGISEDLNRLVGVAPSSGSVIEYNLLTESFVGSTSISSDVSAPSGITYGDGSYFILDSTEKKIARFDAGFSFQSKDTVLDDATDNVWSLHFLSGGFCSYVNALTGELKAARLGSSDIQWKIPLKEAAGSDFLIFGHYYSDDNPLVLNFGNDRAYRYVDGIYDGLYKPSDRVIKSSTHKLYECTIATDDDPEVGVDKKPQTWVEVGPTNKWAAFDDKKSTKSKSNSPYTTQLVPGVTIDSLAGFAISGATDVTIVATSASAGEVFNETINLLNIDLAYDFYTWYTYELDYIDEFVVTNIPPYPDLTIDISFTGTAIEVGNVVTGRGRNLGVLQTGVISDRVDYSRTTIDDFGEETTVIRPITKYSTYPIVIEKVQAPGVLRFLDGLRGLKCVWIGDIGNGQNLTTFGSIERSPLTYDTLSISEYQIKVRGSI